ncbi:glyoxalase superfamily protein [Sutcliffiella halmapala]|uniref:glyoxalase superfamily protein n=1 Tax=Sutcliffiella halmapala TaxID=79882 RepID=UPI001B806D12|nr:glyoxalase superfamily protein [Sutcliffiella halmapala]
MSNPFNMQAVTPIFRMIDVDQTTEFYLDFLGFQKQWEHRFEQDFPLYMEISLGSCVIHLSEHFGDANPGSAIRIETNELDAFHLFLSNKKYKYARPGIERTPWGTREVTVSDPSGNRLVFFEKVKLEEL